LIVMGRLKPGVSLRQAQSSVNVVTERLAEQYRATDKRVTVRVIPERLARPQPYATNIVPFIAGIFLVLAALVLLLACMNVANILLVRATMRQREMAIRAALGAGRWRLIRQLLIESIALALFGGAGGSCSWHAPRFRCARRFRFTAAGLRRCCSRTRRACTVQFFSSGEDSTSTSGRTKFAQWWKNAAAPGRPT
jgi:hypothetical protein